MAARNMGGIGEVQYQSATSPRQRRMGDFGLYRVVDRVYKMRGYYAADGVLEYWQTTNPAAGPPSGHILQNITIAAIITQKELG